MRGLLLALSCLLAMSTSLAQPLAASRATVEPAVVQSLEAGKPIWVMIGLRAEQMFRDVLKETDAIHADRSKDYAQRLELSEAAMKRYRQKLSDLKRQVFPEEGRPGAEKVGELASAAIVFAIVNTLEGLELLTTDPLVESISIEKQVFLAGAGPASP
jgi:hypothetical protein